MRRETNRDFLFTASYLSLFLLLATMLRRRALEFGVFISSLAAISAIGTAGFDAIENVRILNAVATPLQSTTLLSA